MQDAQHICVLKVLVEKTICKTYEVRQSYAKIQVISQLDGHDIPECNDAKAICKKAST